MQFQFLLFRTHISFIQNANLKEQSVRSSFMKQIEHTRSKVTPGLLGLLLVEEVKRSVLGLDRLVTLGTAILITPSFVGEKGVERHVFSTLKRKVTARSVVCRAMMAQGCAPCSGGHGSLGR